MFYPQELLEQVRSSNDIVDVISRYLPLKQKGSSYFGLCPFHNEDTPSFSVSRDKQLYYCFGCGAAGNVISFVMQMENCDFVEAVKKLADMANIKLPEAEYTKEALEEEKSRQNIYEMHRKAGRFFYDRLHSEEGKAALNYIEKRQIKENIQKKFGLGYSPKGRDELYKYLKANGFNDSDILKSGLVLQNKSGRGYHDRFYDRLMFPIIDVSGRIIGFGGRIMDKGEPKYLNSPETIIFNKKKNLYGLNFARASKKKEIIICEGYMDMISIYQAGFTNVAASLGTAFNEEHARLLKKYFSDIILVFDSDEAGEKAALRAIPILVGEGLRVKVLQVPDGKDPDEFIKNKGSLEFSKLLVEAVNYMDFQLKCAKKKYNMEDVSQRVYFTQEASELISKMESPVERDVYTKKIANETGISIGAVEKEVIKITDEAQKEFLKQANRNRIRNYSMESADEHIKNSKGVSQAQRNVIYLCMNNKNVYEKVKAILKPQDYIDDIYIKLAEVIYKACDENTEIHPADMVNYFFNTDEQKKAAEVFALNLDFESKKDMEKLVTESVRLIKRAKTDILALKAQTVEDIANLVAEKKNIEAINIEL